MAIQNAVDREKFEQLYVEYRGLMYHIAYEILQNEAKAEDAVHLAFVAVADNIKKFTSVSYSSSKKYLVALVENKAIELARKKNALEG